MPGRLASFFLAALIAHAAPAQTEGQTMRVCYGTAGAMQKDCSTLADGDFAPSSARSGQAFVLLRPAAHELRFGISGATEQVASRAVEVIIDRSEQAPPIEVSVNDGSGARRWWLTLPAREFAQVQTIDLPAGRYRLTLHAAHYRDALADLPAHSTAKPRIVLRRLPVISGRVLTSSGQPVPNASVQPLPGLQTYLTDFDGFFHCEVDGEWPQSITIAHPLMATRLMTIDARERDTNLGEIRLARGARLNVHVHPPAGVRTAALQLFHDEEGRPSVEMANRTVTIPSSEGVAIASLDPGVYRILIKGARPFQQHASKVVIKEGENEEKIAIEEFELTLHVYSGSRPDAGASIALKNLEGLWSASVQTDDSGTVVEPLWQLGVFTAAVRANGSASPFFDHNEFSTGEKQQWTFHLPIARIEGRVMDETGSAIASAEVRLNTDDRETTTSLHTKTDSSGRYAFDAVRPGAQSVAAAADGYMPSDPTEFRFLDTDTGRSVDLTLHRGHIKSVEIVDARGLPLPGAVIFECVGDRLVNTFSGGATGRAEVQLPPLESTVLLVVPASGSFAVHRVTSVDRDLSSIRIVVPDPAASLDLKTETTEHQPIRDVHFLVRYDGETIPLDLLMQLAQRFGLDFHTGADGTTKVGNLPPGLYELWPYLSAADPRSLMSEIDVPAPLRIAVVPGDNAATLTFRPKHR
jgi:hypothetical protein